MAEEEPFDLSNFLTESLSLEANSPTKAMFPQELKDPYLDIINQDPLEVLEGKGFGEPRDVPEDTMGTPIQEFFRGANVFITGGTGFIGKILTDKLVRSIPHVGKIYLLVREKRGKKLEERFKDLLEDPVFSRMKAEVPHYRSKISAVSGDLSEHGLGLSAADREMLQDTVHVVFHSAADVRFIEPLRRAITSNVLGGKRVLDLAKGMRNLKSYVHVSTAYSNCLRRVIEEKCYPMNFNYKDILNELENKTDAEIEQDESRLLQGWPNTYTFSKAVCEGMVQEEAKGLPVCIYRPSVVWPTLNEPVKGWTDNIYGPNGMLLGISLGVIHIYKINPEIWLDVVPVDLVVNSIIAVAWETATTFTGNSDLVPVYNYTSTPENPVVWKRIQDYGFKWRDAFPCEETVWYTSFIATSSFIVDDIGHFFLHKIPAFVLDRLAEITGGKPRLTRIYDKIYMLKNKLVFFTDGIWEFKNDNVINLWNKMSQEDQKVFNFDIMDLRLEKYFLIAKLGLRYYYLKQNMETLPSSKRKWKWLKWAHNTLLVVSGFVVLKALTIVARILPL